jgi:CBS domain-containing protein
MNVSQLLSMKGHEVFTVKPDDTVATVVATLAERGFGALVVSEDGETIVGIVSERDIVRTMAAHGGSLLDQPVSAIMTRTVRTCNENDSVDRLMTIMTEHRFRHLPVTEGGKLVGLISIGDVVKVRVRQLEHEAEQLERYVRNTW